MKSMRRILIAATAVAALSLMSLAPIASTAADGGYKFPNSVKRSFVKECAKGQATKAQCRCVIRKFDRRYTFRQFIRVMKRAERTGKFRAKDRRLIRSCAGA